MTPQTEPINNPLWSFITGSAVGSVAVSADGQYIAAGSDDNTVYYFSRDGKLLWSFTTRSAVGSVAVSADGQYIAAGSDDNMVYYFSRDGKLLWSYATGSTVESVAVSADGLYVAAGSGDSNVNYFSRDGKLLWSFITGSAVGNIAVSADGQYIAAGSDDNTVYYFSRDGKLLWSYATGNEVLSVAVSADGQYIAAGSGDSKVNYFSRDGKLLSSITRGNRVRKVAVSTDGQYVATGSGDSKVYYYSRDGKVLWSFTTEAIVKSVAISADAQYAAAGTNDNKVYYFFGDSKLHGSFTTGSAVGSVSVSADRQNVAAESSDINNVDYLLLNTILNPPSPQLELAFSPTHISLNIWEKLELTLTNSGKANAKNITLLFSGDVEVRKLKSVDIISAGETKRIEIAVRAKVSGKISLEITIQYRDDQNRSYAHKIDCWLEVVEPITTASIQTIENPGIAESGLRADESLLEEFWKSQKQMGDEVRLSEQITALKKKVAVCCAEAQKIGTVPENIICQTNAQDISTLETALCAIDNFITTATPHLSLTPEKTPFIISKWHRVPVHITNTGNAHAVDVKFTLSDEFETKWIKPATIEARASIDVIIGLRPKQDGNIPLEIQVQYKDFRNKEYKQTFEYWIDVMDSLSAAGVKTPFPFTPKPITPKQLPQELSDNYTDWEFIGKGGFAKVFKAKRRDGQYVAVKIPISLDAATGKSFIAEMQNWTKLSHTNIVKLYDYNIMPMPYFEEELCDSALADQIKPIESEEAAWILFNICEGLKFAHAQKIIHRDLKPQNILIKNGMPKISDWGLSKIITKSTTTTTTSFTPYYAAPEQINKRAKDERTDIWQLGVILYELVTGELPFKGDSMTEIGMSIATKDPILPGEIQSDAKVIDAVVMKCLQKDPANRYQSVLELQKDLAMYLRKNYAELLKTSETIQDYNQSTYLTGELIMVNMLTGDIVASYKYLLDLVHYLKGDVKVEAKELSEQIKMRMEEGVTEIPDELIQKAEIIVHKVKRGLRSGDKECK